MADRAVWLRLVIIVVILGYIAIIVASHFVPLSVFLVGPMAITGWLFLPFLFLWARLRRIDTRPSAQPPMKEMLRPWVLTALYGALVAAALTLAIVWDVPSFCHGPVPLNCVKGYAWSADNGHYYHTTAAGTYGEISRETYVQEVGFDLRSAAVFGVLALCAAWIGAGVFRRSSTGPQPRT
jgi:hypothetical protein